MDNNTVALGAFVCVTLLLLALMGYVDDELGRECSLELDGNIEGKFTILNITTDNGMGHFILDKATGKIKITAPCKYLDELNL